MTGTTVWIAIEHNIEDDHYVNPLGVYSTKNKAIEKIMDILSEYFDTNGNEKDPEDDSEVVTLNELETKLKKNNCCEYVFGYFIKKHVVDQ